MPITDPPELVPGVADISGPAKVGDLMVTFIFTSRVVRGSTFGTAMNGFGWTRVAALQGAAITADSLNRQVALHVWVKWCTADGEDRTFTSSNAEAASTRSYAVSITSLDDSVGYDVDADVDPSFWPSMIGDYQPPGTIDAPFNASLGVVLAANGSGDPTSNPATITYDFHGQPWGAGVVSGQTGTATRHAKAWHVTSGQIDTTPDTGFTQEPGYEAAGVLTPRGWLLGYVAEGTSYPEIGFYENAAFGGGPASFQWVSCFLQFRIIPAKKRGRRGLGLVR